MPTIAVVFYKEDDDTVPVLEWLDDLTPKVRAKCIVKIERLQALGHDLRRPEADYLRDDIHELRIGFQGVNYRLLYFFEGRTIAILSHGLTKESRVPPREIELAIQRKIKFAQNPLQHTFNIED